MRELPPKPRTPEKKVIQRPTLVYVADRKVLVALSEGKKLWYLPGGKKDPGEKTRQALTRESIEEIGSDLIAKTVRKIGKFQGSAYDKPEGTEIVLDCYEARPRHVPQPRSEIVAVDYFDSKRTDEVGPIDRLVFEYLKKNNRID